MKLTAPHWVIVALTIIALVEPEIAQVVPASWVPYLGMAYKVDALVLGALGVTAGSALLGGVAPANTNGSVRGFATTRLLGVLAVTGILGLLVLAPRASSRATHPTVVEAQGCAWFAGNNKQVLTAVGDVGACVVGALLGGASDANAVIARCSGATLADVEALAASLINYFTSPQPSSGAGASLPPALLTSLRAAYADARAKQGK